MPNIYVFLKKFGTLSYLLEKSRPSQNWIFGIYLTSAGDYRDENKLEYMGLDLKG